MKKHTKESLQMINKFEYGKNYYVPKILFDKIGYSSIRLETKMAYVAVLDVLLKKPSFNREGEAFLKVDNPEIVNTMRLLTNKGVDFDKMQKYYQELEAVDMLIIDKQDMYIGDIE